MENELIKEYISILEENKLKNIEAFDLKDKSDVAKFIIIATSPNEKNSRLCAYNILNFFRNKNVEGVLDGEFPGSWIVLDFKDVIIEILTDDLRAYYNLEKLWGSSKNRLLQIEKKRKRKKQ